MQRVKKNRIVCILFGLNPLEGDIPQCRHIQPQYRFIGENVDSRLQTWRNYFMKKYGCSQNKFSRFQWQSSFHNHIIHDEQDLYNYWNCTKYNFRKHELSETWKYTALRSSKLIDGF